MENSRSEAYAAAGVDITAGYRGVELIKKHIARTNTPGVIGGLGGFGGLFEPDLTGMKHPVLVSGTDGVGTKLKIAFLMDRHDTVGIDCVAMCVNDIICGGAKPLFFLDYIACGKNIPERIEQIVKGVCEGCVQAGAALIGGETAEMPGFYPEDEYDLAGYATGIVDRDRIIDNGRMGPGDRVILSGTAGDHGAAVMLARSDSLAEGTLKSDCAPLHALCAALRPLGTAVRVLRDPTRGGVGTVLYEIAGQSGVGFSLEAESIPVEPGVKGVCGMLGLEPLYLACEGRLVIIAPPEKKDLILETLRQSPHTEGAACIGTVTADHPGRVVLNTEIGAQTILPRPGNELLPRIC
jgi:hydrogenase expression/formation protein HypE